MYNSLLLSLERTNDLGWCCLVLDKHSDMIPNENFGSFKSSNGQSEWNQKDCNNLVGGPNKHRCSGHLIWIKTSISYFDKIESNLVQKS